MRSTRRIVIVLTMALMAACSSSSIPQKNSGKEYSDAEKQMAARAKGRYHSLLIKNGIEQSAAYLKELESILPSYLEGLVDGLGENSEELGKTLEGIFNSEEMEKAFEGLGNKLEEIFGGIEETE